VLLLHNGAGKNQQENLDGSLLKVGSSRRAVRQILEMAGGQASENGVVFL
jgi:hypothetical protein